MTHIEASSVGGQVAEVIVMFEESVLGVHYLRAGERFHVGASPDAALCWPIAGRACASPVRVSPSGAIELVASPSLGAAFGLLDADETRALAFTRELDTGARVATLPEHARARVEFEQVTLLVARSDAPRRRRLAPPIELQAHLSTVVVAVVFGLLLAAMNAIPPVGTTLEIDPFLVGDPAHITLVPTASAADPGRGHDAQAAASAAASGPRTPRPQQAKSRDAMARPAAPTTPAPSQAERNSAAERAASRLGLPSLRAELERTHVGSIFGPSAALNDEANAVMGTLDGTYAGAGEGGTGGDGMLATGGHGGRGEQTIGLGNLHTLCAASRCGGGSGSGYTGGAGGLAGRHASAPDVMPGTAAVIGDIDKELIRRIVRRHLNEVKFCYEKELQARPNLDGRLVVGFTIAANGSVLASSVKESSTNDAAVDACVAAAVRRWEFMKQAGGLSVVSYPFVFHAAGR